MFKSTTVYAHGHIHREQSKTTYSAQSNGTSFVVPNYVFIMTVKAWGAGGGGGYSGVSGSVGGAGGGGGFVQALSLIHI